MKNNEAIVMAAVQRNGIALEHTSEEMTDNEATIMAAVQQNGHALQYASKEMTNDPQIVLAAIQRNGRKSTILDRLCLMPISPKGAGMCIKLPIYVHFIAKSSANLTPRVEVHEHLENGETRTISSHSVALSNSDCDINHVMSKVLHMSDCFFTW